MNRGGRGERGGEHGAVDPLLVFASVVIGGVILLTVVILYLCGGAR